MGVKDYWEYAEAGLPNGDVSIEKSSGNLVYTQKDVEIPNEQLEVVLSDDGSYISTLGKYINLKKEDKTEEVKLPKADTIGVGRKEETGRVDLPLAGALFQMQHAVRKKTISIPEQMQTVTNFR